MRTTCAQWSSPANCARHDSRTLYVPNQRFALNAADSRRNAGRRGGDVSSTNVDDLQGAHSDGVDDNACSLEATQFAWVSSQTGATCSLDDSPTEFAESSWRLAYRVRWVRMSQRSSDHSANVVAQVGSNELTSQPHEATPSKERTVALSMPR